MSMKMVFLTTMMIVEFGLGTFSSSMVANAQEAPPQSEQQQELNKRKARFSELQRLAYDAKLADDLELTPDQKKKILIASEKFRDAMRTRPSTKSGEKLEMKAYQASTDGLMSEAVGILTDKQTEKLSELVEQRKQVPRSNYSPEKMREMQKLRSMMSELQRLSYDAKLAAELEVTAEQRVEIREASRDFQTAMQERMKAGQGQAFDLESYNEMIGDLIMDAQDILTPEQTEKLGRSAKLKRLRSKHGDEFAMINGLAKDFDLGPKETLELSETIAEARDVYYDKIQQLKEATMEKIIRELPKENRDEAREAVSDFLKDDPRKKRSPFSSSIRIGN